MKSLDVLRLEKGDPADSGFSDNHECKFYF